MASRFQQQSLRRKLTYFVLIVVLFTAALLLRRWPGYGMTAQAGNLQIREESLGNVELDSSALRLSLSGLRGVLVCYLWYDAQDKQKKHEWNLLEQRVLVLSKLQPHFISPWLFQSWNLAYNVSVEFDRVKDKYFYIARGIELLGEGERQNRDNSEMRFFIGNYTQSKFGISDENNTLRSLYQMSCIDPKERDPKRFRKDGGAVNLVEFEDFCKRHPFLVRRLRDRLRCKTPEDVVDFLEANQKIPSLYEPLENVHGNEQGVTPLKELAERFPVLPPHSRFDPTELTYDSPLADDFDNYAASRAWYSYAQDPIEAPDRRPRYMAKILFQGYPARAQAYVAERREQEGWFDREGWEIPNWFPESPSQPQGPKRVVAVGTDQNWAADAWDRAFQMYKDHGEKHGLYKTQEELVELKRDPRKFAEYRADLQMSNYKHFYFKADVERTTEAVTGRKYFFEADQLRRAAEDARALALYENPAAFGPPAAWAKDKATGWKRILLDHADFRHDDEVQEESYVFQRKYQSLVLKRRAGAIKEMLVLQDLLAQRALAPSPACLWAPLPIHLLPNVPSPFKGLPFKGPLDDVDEENQPLITDAVINRALSRLGIPREAGTGPQPKQPPPSPTPEQRPQ
jgi:hypothetical protein